MKNIQIDRQRMLAIIKKKQEENSLLGFCGACNYCVGKNVGYVSTSFWCGLTEGNGNTLGLEPWRKQQHKKCPLKTPYPNIEWKGEGRMVLYRIMTNPRSNDFNSEPSEIKVKYYVLGESKNGKTWLVERAGWFGKKYQHYVKKSEFLPGVEYEIIKRGRHK